MRYRIRHIADDARLCDEMPLAALASILPYETIRQAAKRATRSDRRQRKLPTELTLVLVVAMNLFTSISLQQVLAKMIDGLRLLWPTPDFETATKGAITQARYRLGARAVVELFRRVCRPLAVATTAGAFIFGLRAMAIDTTTEDVPDTIENRRAFGKHRGGRGESGFVQVLVGYLIECGTHAFVDAGVWHCHANVHACAQRLLRSVTSEMLVMWDCGLHSFDIARLTISKGAQFLSRVPNGAGFRPVTRLADGTYLATIRPSQPSRRRSSECLTVRVIEYTLTDPARVGFCKRHRLMTSLLDANAYKALDLVCAYHERWEVELAIDEMDTHQRIPNRPLRSKKPVGVIQEMYGLLVAHYAVRYVMHDSALRANVSPKSISFTNAICLITSSIWRFQLVDARDHQRLYKKLLDSIATHRLPPRANRINPRVVKRKLSKFPVKRPRHLKTPQPSQPFRNSIALLN